MMESASIASNMKAGSYQEVIQNESCLVHGELQQHKRKVGTWTSRHCALWQNQFLSYKSENETKPQVVFPLDGFLVEACINADTERPYCFQLSKPGVVDHMFATDSQGSLNKWLQKLVSAGVKKDTLTGHNNEEGKDVTKINEKAREGYTTLQKLSKINDTEDTRILDRLLKRNSDKQDTYVKLASFRPLDVDALPGVAGSTPLQSSQSFNAKSDDITKRLRRSREMENLLDAEEEASVNPSDYPSISSTDETGSASNTADSAKNETEGFFYFDMESQQREGRSKSFLEEVLQALGGEVSEVNPEKEPSITKEMTPENQDETKSSTDESLADSHTENTNLVSEVLDEKPILTFRTNSSPPNQTKANSSADVNETNTSDLLAAVNALNSFVKENDTKEHERTISDLLDGDLNDIADKVKYNLSTNEDSVTVVTPEELKDCGPDVTNTSNNDRSQCPPDIIENASKSVGSPQDVSYFDVDFLNFELNTPLDDNVFSEDDSIKHSRESTILANPLLNAHSREENSRSRSGSEKSRTSSIYRDSEFRDLHTRELSAYDTNDEVVMNVSVQKLRQMFNKKPNAESLNQLLKPKDCSVHDSDNFGYSSRSRQKSITRNNAQRSKSVPGRKVAAITRSTATTDDLQWINGGILLNPVVRTPTPSVSSYVNITFQADVNAIWERRWAVLFPHGIYFHEMAGDSRVLFILSTKGLTLEPCALETGRLLAFKIVRKQHLEMVMEPDDVEDLGRWVSGLFRVIQQPVVLPEENEAKDKSIRNNHRPSTPQRTSTPPTPNSSDTGAMVLLQQEESVSVKEMRAVFESAKTMPSSPGHTPTNTPFSSSTSLLSSPPPSIASPMPPYSRSISSSPAPATINNSLSLAREEQPSPFSASSEDSIANYKRMQASMMKMGDKYADVVCWLGRYIEQDQEKEVLNGVANPFLAKLRMRHKLETVARLEGTASEMEKNIANLKERLMAKEKSKNKIAEQPRGRLIRNAEDARRTEDDKKRIDRECTVIQSRIKDTEFQLSQVLESIDNIQVEIQEAYEQFEWTKNGQQEHAANGHNGHGSEHTTTDDEDDLHIPNTEGMPEWTKKAKEKAMAWKMKADTVH